MPRHDQIGIFIDPMHGYRDPVLAGVARYIRTRGRRWRPVLFNLETADMAPLLARWRGDGILYSAANPQMKNAIASRRGRVPAVNVSGGLDAVPNSVISDNRRIGAVAAEHLLERDFARYVLVGQAMTYARERCDGFIERLQEANVACSQFDSDTGAFAGVRRLVRSARPIGVFCVNDSLAMMLQQRLTGAGIVLPRDVAILGAGNWPALCELASPTLSSVEVDFESRGYHAAAMLDGMMAGQQVKAAVLIPPRGVVMRGSTAVYTYADLAVRLAVQFIAENANRPITIANVAAAGGVSRRKLEQRFSALVGRTLHEEIWRRHVDVARRLLETTDLPMRDIARGSGFSSGSSFSTTFQRHTGRTPRVYRAEAQSQRFGEG